MKHSDTTELIRSMPKAELHVHMEGTLEPELIFELAERNGVELPYGTVEEIQAAYSFTDLQSFLNLYYSVADVLLEERDFYDVTRAYLDRAHAENVRHAEIFFDPQTHTARGVAFGAIVRGMRRAMEEARREHGLTSGAIMCFLRDLGPVEAAAVLEQAVEFEDDILGVGLDSAEAGYPPAPFTDVFAAAREAGFHAVAHAGEEGPAWHVGEALELLRVERVDHGVRSLEDSTVVERLARDRIPLTVCPLSNVALRIFPSLGRHPLKTMLDMGLKVTVNSDDPAYFGGGVTENFLAARDALGLTGDDIVTLARNSYEAAFIGYDRRRELEDELDRVLRRTREDE